MKKLNLISSLSIVLFLFFQNITLAQKNIIKGSLTAPLLEHVEFSYERLIKPKESFELKFGIMGVGLIHETTKIGSEGNAKTVRKVPKGFFINAGYRFYQPFNSEKESRNLRGFYLQPDLIMGRYKSYDRYDELQTIRYEAILINIGQQGIISNRVAFDIYLGIGMGYDNQPKENEDSFLYLGEIHRGLYKFKPGLSSAMKAGIKIGYAF